MKHSYSWLSEEFDRLIAHCHKHSLNRVFVEIEGLRAYRDRAAELEKELALLNEALDGAALDYYSDHEHPQYGHEAHSRQQIRKDWLCEAQGMLDVKAREEADETNKEEPK